MLVPKKRKRLVVYVKSVVSKMAIDLQIDPCDLSYVLKRLHSEGLAFLTKTLPAFTKYVLLCCEQQRILDARECGLTHFQLKGNSPCFMQGLLFEAVMEKSAKALYSIRQFCDYFYKTCFTYEKSEVKQAEEKYVAIDQGYNYEAIDWKEVECMRKALHTLFPLLTSVSLSRVFDTVRPHDGPGSFALSAVLATSKRIPVGCYKKLPTATIGSHFEHLSPYAGYFRSYRSSKETLKSVHQERTAELAFVAKDSRGPRTISKEPLHLLKAQMSLGKYMASSIERESNGRVNFTDQTVNQELARVSSITRENATLDLKDASDRVWLPVVRALVRYCPALRSAVTSLRSTHVSLPSKRLMSLNKFANMGSGICFPFLALVVYLSAVVAVAREKRVSIKNAGQLVYVYGDDLIVPSESVATVTTSLHSIGLAINTSKSFVHGYFRESCGADYYHGQSVAPVRLRLAGAELGPVRDYRNGFIPMDNDAAINQIDAHCRELQDAYLTETASFFYKKLETKLGSLPIVAKESAFIGRYHPDIIPTRVEAQKAFYATADKNFFSDSCPYKGLGQSFISNDGLTEDWCLTPIRHRVSLKTRVPELYELACWGLPQHPRDLFNLSSVDRQKKERKKR